MKQRVDTRGWPVMKKQCASCPLRKDKRGVYMNRELAANVEVRCLSYASQICHHPRLSGKRETHLCRGGRDFQLMIFYRLGVLDEPTDECWNRTQERIKITRKRLEDGVARRTPNGAVGNPP